MLISGRFQRYDYGPSQNLVAYGQTVVPEYNVANVTAPVAIYHGLNDWCAAVAVSHCKMIFNLNYIV